MLLRFEDRRHILEMNFTTVYLQHMPDVAGMCDIFHIPVPEPGWRGLQDDGDLGFSLNK